MSESRNRRPDHVRPKMRREDRAKQFAPFAALGRMGKLLKVVEEQRNIGDPEREILLEALQTEDIERLTAESPEEGTDIFGEPW